METLAGHPSLVVSSMSAGNTVADQQSLAMTAPGSASVLPVPDAVDRLPLPENTGPQIEVSNQRDRIQGNPAPGGGEGNWTDITQTGNGGWKQL